jgi:hypothetical protein
MKNVSDKSYRENFSENNALHKIMWKNMVQPDRPQITI